MNIFFIVGTGRCGTQMLRNILEVWENVVVLPETHFIIPLYDKYQLNPITCGQFLEVVDKIYGANGQKWIEVVLRICRKDISTYKEDFSAYVELEGISGGIKEYTEGLFEFLYGQGLIFGDKTPHYGTNLKTIRAIWPEAKVIHLVRDGVYSARSMLGHQGFARYINGGVVPSDLDRVMYKGRHLHYPDKAPPIEKAMDFWNEVINQIQQEFEKINTQERLQVKYEDIIFSPRRTISQIARFLNLDSNARALKKAETIPAPFPELRHRKRRNSENYYTLFKRSEAMMKSLGYPYVVDVKRGWRGFLDELYRGRYWYIDWGRKNSVTFVRRSKKSLYFRFGLSGSS